MLTFHADDYGLSYNVSNDILTLASKGLLDSISIIPNMGCFNICMEMLRNHANENIRQLAISIHLNFMEGHCCASPSKVPLLVDHNGYFKLSWSFLFIVSYHPFIRRSYREQLAIEIDAQIQKFLGQMPHHYRLRIDSHQHTHLTPVVWDALSDVIKKRGCDCEFIRIPAEPVIPYIKVPSLYLSYGLLAFPKNIALHFCAIHACRHSIIPIKNRFSLWGIMMGGHMDSKRVLKLFPYFKKYGQASDILCLLFHPGILLPDELSPEYNNPGFCEAETSSNRRLEYQSVCSLRTPLLQMMSGKH